MAIERWWKEEQGASWVKTKRHEGVECFVTLVAFDEPRKAKIANALGQQAPGLIPNALFPVPEEVTGDQDDDVLFSTSQETSMRSGDHSAIRHEINRLELQLAVERARARTAEALTRIAESKEEVALARATKAEAQLVAVRARLEKASDDKTEPERTIQRLQRGLDGGSLKRKEGDSVGGENSSTNKKARPSPFSPPPLRHDPGKLESCRLLAPSSASICSNPLKCKDVECECSRFVNWDDWD